MSFAVKAAWITAVGAVLIGFVYTLLPDASLADTLDPTPLVIPDVIWNPLASVLHLDRYLPIATPIKLAAAALAIEAGLAGLWLVSWIVGHFRG